MLDANIAFKGKKILVTGAAGFIGFYVAKRLLEQDCAVVGIDNMNDYYDVSLKRARLELLRPYAEFTFYQIDIADKAALDELFAGKTEGSA